MKSLKDLLRNNENYVRAPDRNPLIAPQADLAKTVKNYLNQFETKKLGKIDSPWNRYGSGHSFGDLLFGESPELLDDMSYGKNPFAVGKTGRIPIPDKRLLDMPIPIPSTGGMGVIKKEGQNWLTGSVENALKGLKKRDLLPDDLTRRIPDELNPQTWMSESTGEVFNDSDLTNKSINSWIDGPLTKYIKNRMATPSDEVRKLADQGILHYDPVRQGTWDVLDSTKQDRVKNGFPFEGVAQTPLGKRWEDVSDFTVMPREARRLKNPKVLEENHWLSNLDPETMVHRLTNGNESINDLGIPHLIDELLNATNPESKFPQHLRMKPEGFKGLSMEEAVKKVHGINQHRALQAEAARKRFSRAEGIPETKRYDDGFRFVAPEDVTKNPKHREYVVDAGKRGAWCTQGQACDHYAGGNSRVEILLDDFGNPHAQIAIRTESPLNPSGFYKNLTPERQAEIDRLWDPNLDTNDAWFDALENSPEYQAYLQGPPVQRITEIKPLGNSWDHEKVQELMAKDPNYQKKIQEKLQDFVKSGNWSDVGDLDMVGMKRFNGGYATPDEIRETIVNDSAFKDWYRSQNTYDPPSYGKDALTDQDLMRVYNQFIRDTEVDGGI